MAEQVGSLRGGSLVAGVPVRVLKGEEHSLTCQVTKYSLEDGKSIADHVILNPNTVNIRFEMPNSNGGAEKARDVFQQFAKIRDSRTLITLETEHGRYKNMVIAAFTPDHRAPYKGAYAANLRLEQAGIVGEANMVSASGGRPASILAQDGTQCTACNAQVSGEQQAIAGGPINNRCLAQLDSQGVGRRSA